MEPSNLYVSILTGQHKVLPLLSLMSLLNQTRKPHTIGIRINRFGRQQDHHLLDLGNYAMFLGVKLEITYVEQVSHCDERRQAYVDAQGVPECTSVLFSDDDTFYPPDFVESALSQWETCDTGNPEFPAAICGTLVEATNWNGRFDVKQENPMPWLHSIFGTPEQLFPNTVLNRQYGGTIFLRTRFDVEALYAWTKVYPEMVDDKLLFIQLCQMGERVWSIPVYAYHFRKLPAVYATGPALVNQAIKEMK